MAESNSPNPLSMPPSPRRRPSNCGTPWCPACKITPAGRKVFMLQYRTNAGERRKPAWASTAN